jgi:DNA-binding response OmpR family regulator
MTENAECHILVVDDQENWRKLLYSLLSEEGYVVDLAADFEQADHAISHRSFDVLVLDVRLKDTDIYNVQGLELLRRAKSQKQNTKVIVLTGYAESIHEGVLDRLGADALVLKVPSKATFDSHAFRELVYDLLHRPH